MMNSIRRSSHKHNRYPIGRILGLRGGSLAAGAPVTIAQDVNQDIIDIYGPLTVPLNYTLIAVIALLVLAALAVLFFFVTRKIGRKQTSVTTTPPSIKALNELERAAAETMPHDPMVFAERLSEVLRRFIEEQFGIHSTRQTTREFLDNISDSANPHIHALTAQQEELKEILQLCDLAKYAQKQPGNESIGQMADRARQFITRSTEREDGDNADC